MVQNLFKIIIWLHYEYIFWYITKIAVVNVVGQNEYLVGHAYIIHLLFSL